MCDCDDMLSDGGLGGVIKKAKNLKIRPCVATFSRLQEFRGGFMVGVCLDNKTEI